MAPAGAGGFVFMDVISGTINSQTQIGFSLGNKQNRGCHFRDKKAAAGFAGSLSWKFKLK
jgi:hypothetical protein